jgi:hypothetical protein
LLVLSVKSAVELVQYFASPRNVYVYFRLLLASV